MTDKAANSKDTFWG